MHFSSPTKDMFPRIYLLSVLFCHGFCQNDDKETQITASTFTGVVMGTTSKTIGNGTPYYTFLGIPYAEPPLGDLRFEPPVPKSSWSGVWDARYYRPMCVQEMEPVKGSEDCLFINIFTPQMPKDNSSLLPVIIWIHGGAFVGGTGNLTDTSPDYFLEQNVIFVSIQYRLGLYGFLSTNDLVVPGNMGLKDQVQALKWIHSNIESFGGDNNNVTLFGQSAGAASVSYLLQSKLTEGLYNRAIMDSGVSLCLWALFRNPKEIAKTIGNDLGVNVTTSKSLVDGLKKLDYKKLQTAYRKAVLFKYLTTNPRNGFLFTPALEPEHDGAFMTKRSHQFLKSGEFRKVPILLGHNSLEAALEIQSVIKLYLIKYDLDPSELVPIDLNLNRTFLAGTSVGNQIKQHYFGILPVVLSDDNLMQFVSDDQFVRPIQEFVKLWSKHAPTYYYQFSYESRVNSNFLGIGHTQELRYLFNWKDFIKSSNDFTVSQRMIKLWTNFAKTGKPTIGNDELLENIEWPAVNIGENDNLAYLNIGSNLTVGKNPNYKHMKFWTKLYQKYGNPPYDTY